MNSKNNEGNNTKAIHSKGQSLNLESPLVMGVINCNQDSFFAGSRVSDSKSVQRKLDQLIAEGADIIDIGGRSSRPGSVDISVQEELDRVGDALLYMQQHYPEIWTSIDTTQAAVAEAAVEAGVYIVNDISSGDMDPMMLSTVARLGVPYICMHMQGTPKNMQENPVYGDVVSEVSRYLNEKIEACQVAGIKQIVVDPGFGFGKTIEHNYALLKNLSSVVSAEIPLLVGFSRKSMIYKLLGITADEALNGTTALNMAALMRGASILRVHDVKEAMQVVRLFNEIQ